MVVSVCAPWMPLNMVRDETGVAFTPPHAYTLDAADTLNALVMAQIGPR